MAESAGASPVTTGLGALFTGSRPGAPERAKSKSPIDRFREFFRRLDPMAKRKLLAKAEAEMDLPITSSEPLRVAPVPVLTGRRP